MLTAVLGGHGCSGVTTTAVGLAAAWPRRPVVLAEADAAGAVLPYRVKGADGEPLSLDGGIVPWAAATRRTSGEDLWPYVQEMDGGLPVLVGPRGSAQAVAIGSLWSSLADSMATWARGDVVADLGRVLQAGGPTASIIERAHSVVIVTRATLEGVASLRATIDVVSQIRAASGLGGLRGVTVAVIDPTPGRRFGRGRSGHEVGEVLGAVPGLSDVPVLGVLPWDPATAAAWSTGGRMPSRSRLVRQCAAIAAELCPHVPATVREPRGSELS